MLNPTQEILAIRPKLVDRGLSDKAASRRQKNQPRVHWAIGNYHNQHLPSDRGSRRHCSSLLFRDRRPFLAWSKPCHLGRRNLNTELAGIRSRLYFPGA
jgi:hypothetical protein